MVTATVAARHGRAPAQAPALRSTPAAIGRAATLALYSAVENDVGTVAIY